MYFYEGRTVRGLRGMVLALGAQLAVTAAMGAFLLALVAALGPVVRQPQLPDPYMLIAMSAGFSYILAQLVVGVLFVAGFVKLRAGAREFGPEHEARMEPALVLFILSIVALFASYSVPSTGLTPEPSFVSPAPSAPQAFLAPFLGGLAALLAGLTLFLLVKAFADRIQRRRMGLAIALGIAGGTGRQFLMLLGAVSPASPDSVPLMVVSVAVVGSGISAVSLALFLRVYRDLRRRILAGSVPPRLPPPPAPWPGAFSASPAWPPIPPSSPPR